MPTTAMMIEALISSRNDPQGAPPEHFWKLVERFRADLVNQALAILGHQADAEDVAQDSLCQAFQGLSQLRNPEALGHWLRSINRHNALRLARLRRKRGLREERLPTGANPPAGGDAPGQPTREQLTEQLARAIDRLPDEFRVVVLYRYWEQLQYDEIAVRLGVPLGTVKSRLARADRLLFRSLRPALAANEEVQRHPQHPREG